MPNFSITDFWARRLVNLESIEAPLVKGWSFEKEAVPSFHEAPLRSNNALNDGVDIYSANLVFISAPGAVGKSTLAKQIAFLTKSLYINLAEAEPVGGNSISGGLAKSKLYSEWQDNRISALIDGLDEARIRVTQEAFEAFLTDVSDIAADRTAPTFIFGRTGSVQDAWLFLQDRGVKPAVLEIGYYDPGEAVKFAAAQVRATKPNSPHAQVELDAVEALVNGLLLQTASDGDRFAGYAPVLQAIAERVSGEENPAVLLSKIEKGENPVTLRSVVDSILERERSKLRALDFQDKGIAEKLYSSDEQLGWLTSRIYGTSEPALPAMKPTDAQSYASALKTWVDEHPFLQGRATASSAVFDAVIAAHALKSPQATDIATQRELSKGVAANPFLSDFYLQGIEFIPPDHIGVVYSSLRARLSLGDNASLNIEASEDEESLEAEIEILVLRENGAERLISLKTEQIGAIRLGGHVENVGVSAPYSTVEIGAGGQILLVAPVAIQCDKIRLAGTDVIVESPKTSQGNIVTLEANQLDGRDVSSPPSLRGSVSLSCAWPGAKVYPWTAFASEPAPVEDPRLEEALRRFRKFVTAFRSHSKGNLARYKHKLDHARMTKGRGQAVLDLLIKKDIITLDGAMYYLDPDALGRLTGATYAECVARKFNKNTVEFINEALSN